MKTLVFFLFLLIVGCSSSFDGVKVSDVNDFESEINVSTGDVYIYKSPAVVPVPKWYRSNDNLNLSEFGIEDDNGLKYIVKAAGNYLVKSSDDNGIEGSNKIAWANARKKFYDSWIEVFDVNSQVVGSNADSRISQEESFYRLISRDVSGVSPLTELKSFYAYDTETKNYTCYSLYYVRMDELIRRIEKITDREERDRYELSVNRFMKKYYQ